MISNIILQILPYKIIFIRALATIGVTILWHMLSTYIKLDSIIINSINGIILLLGNFIITSASNTIYLGKYRLFDKLEIEEINKSLRFRFKDPECSTFKWIYTDTYVLGSPDTSIVCYRPGNNVIKEQSNNSEWYIKEPIPAILIKKSDIDITTFKQNPKNMIIHKQDITVQSKFYCDSDFSELKLRAFKIIPNG